MAHPRAIREGIAANLAGIGDGYQVSAYVLTNPQPPCAYVKGGPIDYDETFGRGHDAWTWTVYVLVGYASDIGAQMLLDEFRAPAGERSVKALIESDPQLGGAALRAWVTNVSAANEYVIEGQPPALGCEWTVVVWADGRE